MTHEEKAIELVNKTLEECKRACPQKFQDVPTANLYNLQEIYDYLKG